MPVIKMYAHEFALIEEDFEAYENAKSTAQGHRIRAEALRQILNANDAPGGPVADGFSKEAQAMQAEADRLDEKAARILARGLVIL